MAFSVTFHQLIRKFPAFECQKHQWMPGCLFNKAYIFPRARCFRLWIQNRANFHWKIRHFSKPMLELCGWHFDEEYCLINYTALWNCFLFVCLFLLRISQKLFNQSNRTWNHMFLKTWSLKLENEYSPFWRKKMLKLWIKKWIFQQNALSIVGVQLEQTFDATHQACYRANLAVYFVWLLANRRT